METMQHNLVHAGLKTRGATRSWEAGLDQRFQHIMQGEPIAADAADVTCATCLPFVSLVPAQRAPDRAS